MALYFMSCRYSGVSFSCRGWKLGWGLQQDSYYSCDIFPSVLDLAEAGCVSAVPYWPLRFSVPCRTLRLPWLSAGPGKHRLRFTNQCSVNHRAVWKKKQSESHPSLASDHDHDSLHAESQATSSTHHLITRLGVDQDKGPARNNLTRLTAAV